MPEEVVHATGHDAVTAGHESTFEVTGEDFLTPAGDCILGVAADRVPAGFDDEFVAQCRDATATITAAVTVGGETVTVKGRGDPALTFASQRSLVGRTSDYVDDRTVLVDADHAAADLPRSVVEALAGGAAMAVRLRVD